MIGVTDKNYENTSCCHGDSKGVPMVQESRHMFFIPQH